MASLMAFLSGATMVCTVTSSLGNKSSLSITTLATPLRAVNVLYGVFNVFISAASKQLSTYCLIDFARFSNDRLDGISSCGDYEEDAFEALYEVINVPTTILALNDVEASGVEKFAQHRHVQAFDVGVMADTGEISNILDFAARLREGAQ